VRGAPVHAHMDGNAQATMTDCLDLLWHIKWFGPNNCVPKLHVTDDHEL
jgi:hypothetical protein